MIPAVVERPSVYIKQVILAPFHQRALEGYELRFFHDDGLRCRADNPFAKRREARLVPPRLAVDQVPVHAFRHAILERRRQSAGAKIVVDVGLMPIATPTPSSAACRAWP